MNNRKTLESVQFECNTADTSTSHTKNEHIANIEGAKVHHNLSHCKRVSWLKVLFDVHPQMQKHPKHQPVGSENREGRLIYKNTICGYPYKFHREYPLQSQAIRQSKYIKSSLHIHSNNTFKYECHLTTPATALNILAPAVVKRR